MSAMEAINGLLINNEYMSIISNNIANASTIGYKSSKPVFFDIFSYSRESNKNYGYGVGISNIIQNFNNGTLIETGRDLDLGIIHDGFFRVIDTQGNIHYTRDGQFLLDKNKNIINMQGMYLTGKNQSYTKNRLHDISILKPINLDSAFILKEKPTSKIQLQAVFNSNTNAFNNIENDNGNISKLEDYSTDFDIYKKNGQKEKINIYFNKEDKNIWKVHIESANPAEKNINKTFELKFNSNGELISDPNINICSEDENYENITLDLSGTIEQSDQENTIINKFQNGNEKASLKTFNIAPNGEIIGTYSNQKQQPIGQILLSRFINPEKLKPESGNLWSATTESGPENIGIAGDLGFGVLSQKTLETSNVDLNKELINMIIAQRNYQSNAQSFKTEDKIINTLINLR